MRGAYVHRDRVNGILRPRRGASITALTSGGAMGMMLGSAGSDGSVTAGSGVSGSGSGVVSSAGSGFHSAGGGFTTDNPWA